MGPPPKGEVQKVGSRGVKSRLSSLSKAGPQLRHELKDGEGRSLELGVRLKFLFSLG